MKYIVINESCETLFESELENSAREFALEYCSDFNNAWVRLGNKAVAHYFENEEKIVNIIFSENRDYSIYINDCQEFTLLLNCVKGRANAEQIAKELSENLNKKLEVMDKIESDSVCIYNRGIRSELNSTPITITG